MEQHRQQYLGEKIALIRNIREGNKVRAQGGCNRVIQISVRIFLPIRLCVLSKRIYSSRVKLGVPCNILNTLIDISRSVVARSSFLELYISLLFALFLLRYTLSSFFVVRFLDNTRSFDFLTDAGGCSSIVYYFTHFFVYFVITSIVKLIRILGINYKSFWQTLIQIETFSRTSIAISSIDTESKHRSRRSKNRVGGKNTCDIRGFHVAQARVVSREKRGEGGCARANARSLMNRIVGDPWSIGRRRQYPIRYV